MPARGLATMARMGRHAWLDLSAGVAGDMLLAACVDAGADLAAIESVVRQVVGPAVSLRAERVTRAGQRATRMHVVLHEPSPPHRTWRSIQQDLLAADVPEWTRSRALAVFATLADAEGLVHGIDPADVHFHEVGALDSIADVVGTCEGMRLLGVTSVSASPVALGEGRIRAAHGDIPVPAPAVAQLAIGWQVRGLPGLSAVPDTQHEHPHQHPQSPAHPHEHGHEHRHVEGPDMAGHDHPAPVTTPGSVGELATPTGMALVRALAVSCEGVPAMTLAAVGVGAGGKDFPTHPNVARLLLGEAGEAPSRTGMRELRANIDDMDPRLWPGVLDALLRAGAADAWLSPILMKKGRPAHCLTALVTADHADGVADAMLRHTTTLGVRWAPVERAVLQRGFAAVSLDGATVQVKVGHRDGHVVHAAAEFADVQRLAAAAGARELDVLARANAAIVAAGWVPGAPLPGELTAPEGAVSP